MTHDEYEKGVFDVLRFDWDDARRVETWTETAHTELGFQAATQVAVDLNKTADTGVRYEAVQVEP